MKSTWKFPFWVQENDGTVTQLTWSFLLVNPSLVADFLTLQLLSSRASCSEQNQPPPTSPLPYPTDISVESLQECISAWTYHHLIPQWVQIGSRPTSGPFQDLGDPCRSCSLSWSDPVVMKDQSIVLGSDFKGGLM